uniref:phage tail tip lysozyme n=1 Tax=Methylocella sp. TaxID=1978226 RepID=UPI003784CFE9
QSYAYQKFLEAGHTPQSASAMVANLSGESGRALRADAMNNSGTETPGAVNSRGSYGIAQWNGDRQFGLLQYARQTGGDPRSLDTQIGYVDHELKTQYPDLYAASRDPNATSAGLLQRYVADYERPADVAGGVRQRSQYLGLNYGSAAPAQPTRGVQLAGPVPTPDTGAPPTALAPRASAPGFQAIAPQGAPTAADVADAQAILTDPVSPANARAYAQGVLQRAGGSAQASAAAPVDPEQARWQARTSPPGGPAIPASGAPMPPPRPDFGASAAAGAQQQGQQQLLPPPHAVASVATHAMRDGFDPLRAIQQFFGVPMQVAQGLLGSLMGSAQAAPAQGGVVPDGRGGMVPANNSRVAPDGSFLPPSGAPAPQANQTPGVQSMGGPAPLQQPYMAPQGGGGGQPQGGAPSQPMITAFGTSYPLSTVLRMYGNPISKQFAAALLEQAGKHQETFSTFQDGQGNVWARSNLTGKPEVVLKADAPVSVGAGTTVVDPRTGHVLYAAPDKPTTVSAGSALVDPNTGKPIYVAPEKAATTGPDALPATVAARRAEGEKAGLKGNALDQYSLTGTLPKDVQEKAPTEGQANAALYSERMREADKIIADPEIAKEGLNPINKGLDAIPIWGNGWKGENAQLYDQAQRDFVNATLRRESGAAISESEFDNARKQYFPQPGDGPKVIAQKAANRRTAIEGITNAASPAYIRQQQEKAQKEQSAAPAPPTQQERGAATGRPVAPRGNPVPANDAPKFGQVPIPMEAATFLRAHPEARDQFDAKYGAGASSTVLGGR